MASEYRQLTAQELAALPPRAMNIEDLTRAYDDHRARLTSLQRSWILGLAVANGGALTALSNKLLDALSKEPDRADLVAFAVVYPSVWFFALGFVLVGIAVLQEIVQAHRQIDECHRSIRVLQQNSARRGADVLQGATWRDWAPEILSGGAFVLGLTYPMIVLGLRYFRDGGFTW